MFLLVACLNGQWNVGELCIVFGAWTDQGLCKCAIQYVLEGVSVCHAESLNLLGPFIATW
jgi:hypothetical protein